MKGNFAESFTGNSTEVIFGRTRHRGMRRGRKRLKKASGLDIVDVVVVIGVVVGPGDEGNSKKASVRTIVGVVVIVNVAEGTEAGEE